MVNFDSAGSDNSMIWDSQLLDVFFTDDINLGISRSSADIHSRGSDWWERERSKNQSIWAGECNSSVNFVSDSWSLGDNRWFLSIYFSNNSWGSTDWNWNWSWS